MYIARLLLLLGMVTIYLNGVTQDERTQNFPRKTIYPKRLPKKENVWIFVLAGQSNMAGRGIVEPQDTLPNARILTSNRNNEIVVAKEPLHFYEPNLTGLDCGVSFASRLLKNAPGKVTILLVPAAVGGSSSQQWLDDSVHRDVKLLTNLKQRVEFAKQHGVVKGILWHQGEADADSKFIPGYDQRLEKLFAQLRSYCDNPTLPILVGELGSYSENPIHWNLINEAIHRYAEKDLNVRVVATGDLSPKEDRIHFNSAGQRKMGERMAEQSMSFRKD
jgi:hypothetical protein